MTVRNLALTWKKNIYGAPGPFKFPGLFVAGSTTPIKSGEILVLAAGTWAPIALDAAMVATVAVAAQERRSGDLAGYQMLIVPRPGDIFEYALDAATAPAIAAPLYVNVASDPSQKLTATPGTNIIGYVQDPTVFPIQGNQSVAPSYDALTTLRTVSSVLMVFKASVSYWAALNP